MKGYIAEILGASGNPSPKSELFAYRYYDKTHDLYINAHKTMGFVLEIKPVVGVKENTIEQLSLLLDEYLPANSFLQFIMFSSTDLSPITDPWLANYDSAAELFQSLAQKRVDNLQKLTKTSDTAYRLKHYRILVTFAKECDYNKKSITEINNFRESILSVFKSCNILVLRPTIDEFISITSAMIAPESEAGKHYNEHEPLYLQIASGSPILVSHNKISLADDYQAKAYVFEKTPKEFSLHEMINLLGDTNQDSLQIPGKLILCYTISTDISERKQAIMKDKGQGVLKGANSFFSRFDGFAKLEAEEWYEASKMLDQRKRLLSTCFTVTLIARQDNFHQAEQNLNSVYITNNFKLKALDYFMLPGFLACLPFGLANSNLFTLFKNFSLAKTTLSSEPLSFLPIHGEWQGNGNQGLLLAGRLGQPFTVDIFTGESNNNTNVIGESGSGKSVLIQDLVSGYMALGARIIILDIGRSYERICKLYGGDFIEFKIDSDICLNPFDKADPQTPEELNDFLSLMLPILAKMAAPKRGTTDIEDAILASCLHSAWVKYEQNTTINKIAAILASEGSETASNLAKMLFQYGDNGTYGRFFNGKSNVDLSKKMIVFEFEELRERKDLLAVIMQMISAQVLNQIFSGNREERNMIVFDEAWFALDLFPKTLVEIARTIRKYQGSLVIGTQSVNDFYVNETAKVILETSAWLIMLKQKPSAVDLLLESKRASIDKNQVNLIKTLQKNEKYSECLISNSGGYTVGRLILDPFKKILYSSSPKEFSAVQKLIKAGYSVEEAVQKISEKIYA